jgi:hypothetical protein
MPLSTTVAVAMDLCSYYNLLTASSGGAMHVEGTVMSSTVYSSDFCSSVQQYYKVFSMYYLTMHGFSSTMMQHSYCTAMYLLLVITAAAALAFSTG